MLLSEGALVDLLVDHLLSISGKIQTLQNFSNLGTTDSQCGWIGNKAYALFYKHYLIRGHYIVTVWMPSSEQLLLYLVVGQIVISLFRPRKTAIRLQNIIFKVMVIKTQALHFSTAQTTTVTFIQNSGVA